MSSEKNGCEMNQSWIPRDWSLRCHSSQCQQRWIPCLMYHVKECLWIYVTSPGVSEKSPFKFLAEAIHLFIYLSHKSLSYFPTFLATHSCPISLLLEFILASHLSEMETPDCRTYILFFKFIYFILFIYGCVGSSFLCEGFLQLRRAGTTLHRGARASHYRGLSCSGAQAPDAQAQ